MPYPIAQLSKRDIRGDVAAILGDNWPLETTSGGSTTTAVFSSLIGVPIASVQNKYLLIEEGEEDGEYRVASSFAPASGTVTVRRAYSGTIATSMSAHLHDYSPHLYTLGINEAIRETYRAVYRPILHHTFVRQPGTQRTIPLPRDMERVMRVMEDQRASEKVRDYFDRSDSTSAPGGKWAATVGTWGITSEGLYCVSDTDGDLIIATPNPHLQNGVIEWRVRGDTTNSASRVLSLVFRVNDDFTAALGVRLINSTVVLRKLDGGSWSTLTSATATTTEAIDYVVRVQFDGSWVSVWVDDRQYIQYELTGTDLQYLGYAESGEGTYGNFGFRLEKEGSPSLAATATRVGHVFAHEIVGRVERGDWQRTAEGRMIDLRTQNRGWALTEGKMLWLEGAAPLTQLTADTTFESLASDSTDVVEIQTTDPAYEVLVQWAAYAVLRSAAQPAHTANPEKRREYAELALQQRAVVERVRARKAMRYPARAWG
jgi:hypothetical protein